MIVDELKETKKQQDRNLWEQHKGPRTFHINIRKIRADSNIPPTKDWATPHSHFIVVPMC